MSEGLKPAIAPISSICARKVCFEGWFGRAECYKPMTAFLLGASLKRPEQEYGGTLNRPGVSCPEMM